MAELIGKSINDLNVAPALLDTSCIAVQREGSSRIEKAKLGSVAEYLTKSNTFQTLLKKTVTESGGESLLSHTSHYDPHGDKAYTDNKFLNHLNADDPHGDRLYTNSKIIDHIIDNDPHGDRGYAISLINDHKSDLDPHGDREYTDNSIIQHSDSLDPHGDRGYSLNLLLEHKFEDDPHGLVSKINHEMYAHKNEDDPHGLYTKIIELLESHNNDEESHPNLTYQLKNLNQTVVSELNNALSHKLGTVLPFLENGTIPNKFLNKTLIINSEFELPTIGEENILYINTSAQSMHVWYDSRYIAVGGANGFDTIGLSTDEVEPGGNENRQYFSKADKEALEKKIEIITTDETGISTYNKVMSSDGSLFLKSLASEGNIQIIEDDTKLTFKTDDYIYKASYNEDVILTSDTDLLDNIDYNDLIILKGVVTATNYKAAGNMRLVNYLNRWEVNAVLATQGSSTPVTKPYGMVISSNGLVITGQTAPTHNIEVYSMTNDLLGEAVSLTEGSFTVVLNSAELTGRRLKLYTVTPEGNRSEPSYFFTNNTTSINGITAVSFNKLGDTIRGITSRGTTVKITDSNQVELGSGLTDEFGNFNIKLNKSLLTNDMIRITAKLGADLTTTLEHTVNIKDIEAPYLITYNIERTVLKGYAEPNAVISFRYNNRTYSTATDSQGRWTLFLFSDPIITNEDLIFTVKQEERVTTTAINIEESYSDTTSDLLVKENVTNFETKFLVKTITTVLGKETDAELDLVFNSVTRNLEIRGKNKDGQEVIWLGQFNIIKDSLDIQEQNTEESLDIGGEDV